MRKGWEITHDPLGLWSAQLSAGRVEAEAKEWGEDLLQAELIGTSSVVDLGWYQDRYVLCRVENANWDQPVGRFEFQDLESSVIVFRRLIAD